LEHHKFVADKTEVKGFLGFCLKLNVARGKTKVHNKYQFVFYFNKHLSYVKRKGHRGHDRMVVGFVTTCAIGAYHYQRCDFESRSGEVYSIQHYVIKFI
jgi:hypothetical protein